MNDHETLARPLLSVELAERIRRMVMAGELKDGQKVPEGALCERFGVSRTPLREALKILSAEGFLQFIPNRGARVTALTLADVEEGFPVLAALESLSGELAASRITAAEIAGISEMNAAMRVAFETGERLRYFELNQAIHRAILDGARNPTLSQHHQMLCFRLRWARYISNLGTERWRRAMDEHDLILEAIEARDGPALGRILRHHLENKLDAVKTALAAAQAEAG